MSNTTVAHRGARPKRRENHMSNEFEDDYGYDWQPPSDDEGRGFDDGFPF